MFFQLLHYHIYEIEGVNKGLLQLFVVMQNVLNNEHAVAKYFVFGRFEAFD